MNFAEMAPKEAVKLLRSILAELAPVSVMRSYAYEPGLFHGEFPAMSVHHRGALRTSGATDERERPNVHRFRVSFYVPISQANPQVDGLQQAQDEALEVWSDWLESLADDPQIASRVIYAQAQDTEVAGQPGREPLYIYRTNVLIQTH